MKLTSLLLMVVLYIFAGLNHFWNPEFYKKIMPPWLPLHYEIIFVSGVAEVIIALLLIPVTTRYAACLLLIALLVLVFPANVQMTINFWKANNPWVWATIVRLLFQGVLIWWAWSLRNYTQALLS